MNGLEFNMAIPSFSVNAYDDQPKKNDQFTPEKVDCVADGKPRVEKIDDAISKVAKASNHQGDTNDFWQKVRFVDQIPERE